MASTDLDCLRMIVTGGASGIGLAVTEAALARGAIVCVLDLDPTNTPSGATGIVTDVADDESAAVAVAHAAEAMDGIDIVINNAGIGAQGTVETNTIDEWRHVFDVNVFGIVRITRAALPHLRRSSNPAVVNTCSIAATAGLPDRALYSATKGAVLSLTLAMAADHVGEGIRVNCVNPGTADTPWIGRLLASADDPALERAALEARQPMGRLVTAEEVAAAILHLASPAASATTGTALAVDGGMAGLRMRPGRRWRRRHPEADMSRRDGTRIAATGIGSCTAGMALAHGSVRTMDPLAEVAPVFVGMAHRIVWCTVATTGGDGRPRTRVLHPIWEWDGTTLTGWIATSPKSPKASEIADVPAVSLTYWSANHDTCSADCDAVFESAHSARNRLEPLRRGSRAGRLRPLEHPAVDQLRRRGVRILCLTPHRLRVMDGTVMTGGTGRLLSWRA